jgi:hypothetical protein
MTILDSLQLIPLIYLIMLHTYLKVKGLTTYDWIRGKRLVLIEGKKTIGNSISK